MASDYTIAANSILAVLKGVVDEMAGSAPDIGGWRESVAARMPSIAGQCAKAAVDALNTAHGANVVPMTGVPPMTDPTVTPPAPGVAGTILQEVLGYLQVGCGVIAEYSAIETLITTFPFGAVAVTIANTVCDAVRSTTGGRSLQFHEGPRVVTVRGVRVPIHALPSFQ